MMKSMLTASHMLTGISNGCSNPNDGWLMGGWRPDDGWAAAGMNRTVFLILGLLQPSFVVNNLKID